MQRQRPMSTRTGIPTAATYVFVNMINKLRKDFAPEYLAAVYDVSGPVFRDERAREMKPLRKWNVKTQQFDQVDYAGYKANRAEMPADLAQQLPYIRRALEAFRIPILSYEGFEADDVIGTLSHKLAALGHCVYVVSSDKDMMQLVTPDVSILNPTKDNLVLDPAGDPKSHPRRVLRPSASSTSWPSCAATPSITSPGAPGIGDKGSVELIQQFGSVEAALDAAVAAPDSIKRKTYRESLQNNRDNILLSKELVTIHTEVPIEFSVDDMRTQPVDNPACRDLFSELEFTTMLKEARTRRRQLHRIRLQPQSHSERNCTALLANARKPLNQQLTTDNQQLSLHGLAIAIFEDARAIAEEVAAEPDPESGEPEPPPAATMDLFARPSAYVPSAVPSSLIPVPSSVDPACRLGLSITGESALEAPSTHPTFAPHSKTPRCPSTSTISKPSSARLPCTTSPCAAPSPTSCSRAISSTLPTLHTRCLTSPRVPPTARWSINPPRPTPPTRSACPRPPPPSSASARVFATQARRKRRNSIHTNPKLRTGPNRPPPAHLPNHGSAAGPCPPAHGTGRRPHRSRDALCNVVPSRRRDGHPRRAHLHASRRNRRPGLRTALQRQLAQTTRRCAVQQNAASQAAQVRQGQSHLHTAQDVLEELGRAPSCPGARPRIPPARQTPLHLPRLAAHPRRRRRPACTPPSTRSAPPPAALSSTNPNLQNIPIRTVLGREIRAAFIPAPGNLLLSADYSQIELRLMAHFSQDPLLLNAYRTGQEIHTLTASEGLRHPRRPGSTRKPAPAPRQSTSVSSTASPPSASPRNSASTRRKPAPTSANTSSATPASADSSTRRWRPSAATRPCALTSAASAPFQTSSRATPTCAASPSAPPLTRRCRAPPLTSTS